MSSIPSQLPLEQYCLCSQEQFDFILSIIKCQMSDNLQKWIRENFELIEKIRHRFEKYFKLQQSMRYSYQTNSSEEDVSAKIQNEWRKLNDLLSKQIPQKITKVDQSNAKNLDLLRLEALRIQSMFKTKFGQEKHNQFQLIQRTESWRSPVFNSRIEIGEVKNSKIKLQQIPIQDQTKVKTSFIQLAPGEKEKQLIQSLEEGERRSSSRIIKVEAESKRIKICGYFLFCTLLLVLVMSYLRIPLHTKLFTYFLQIDL